MKDMNIEKVPELSDNFEDNYYIHTFMASHINQEVWLSLCRDPNITSDNLYLATVKFSGNQDLDILSLQIIVDLEIKTPLYILVAQYLRMIEHPLGYLNLNGYKQVFEHFDILEIVPLIINKIKGE